MRRSFDRYRPRRRATWDISRRCAAERTTAGERPGTSGRRTRLTVVADPATLPARLRHHPRITRGLSVPRRRSGRVIYVGKAKNLRGRLNSYFADFASLHPRTQTMLHTAAGVDWTVVGTEVEALQLEYSWIKEFDPRFNVKYRDDKSYPYLAVTHERGVPARAGDARGQEARASATSARTPTPGRSARPSTCCCASSRCAPARAGVFRAPASRPAVPARLHRQVLRAVRRPGQRGHPPRDRRRLLRLHGRPDASAFMRRAGEDMSAAADRRRSTSAPRGSATTSGRWSAPWRNSRWCSATAPTATSSRSPTTSSKRPSRCSTYAAGGSAASAAGSSTRSRRSTPGELVEQFLLQTVPRQRRGRRCRARSSSPPSCPGQRRPDRAARRAPRRPGRPAGAAARRQEDPAGDRRSATPRRRSSSTRRSRATDLTSRSRALQEIQDALELGQAPLRIECYDVSNLQGTDVVASMVVFEDGLPRKSEYRRFAIKTVEGQDDVRSINEVISRRFRRYLEEPEQTGELDGPRRDRGRRPDRPRDRQAAQVRLPAATSSSSTAGRRRSPPPQRALDELGIDDIALCGIAKRLEEIWLPGEEDPVILPRNSEGMYLLQRVATRRTTSPSGSIAASGRRA